jgi:hypothetical protein
MRSSASLAADFLPNTSRSMSLGLAESPFERPGITDLL